MINLLDYVQDLNDNFWIVNLIDDYYKGYMVYEVSDEGTKYNNITKKKYIKHNQKGFEIIPAFKKIYSAHDFYKSHKNKLSGVWKSYVDALNEIGISDDSIGIFGSYLIGFDITKDVDFVIYGRDNLNLYYNYNDYIKNRINATYITKEHMKHQYEKHKNNYSSKCDLFEIISRNWSGVQICEGVLSTPRFVDLDNQVSPKDGEKQIVQVEVISGLESAMLPRFAEVLYEGEKYKLISNVWKYQSFAKSGDILECLGVVDKISKTIYLSDNECYIKYLNECLNTHFILV